MAFIDNVRTEQCHCVPPPTGMAGWWPLDEPTGTTALDGALGHDGTHQGTLPMPRSSELVNGSLDFNGSDNYVRVGDPADGLLDFGPHTGPGSSDFSIEAWIRPQSISGY